MKHPEFPYVDLAVGTVRARNHIVPIREALNERTGRAAENSFITVFRFPAAYREHVEATGSVRGYAGPMYADFLPFDIDRAGNLHSALQAARALAFTLEDLYDVRADQLRVFFSGAKGFHLLIPTALFGEVEPSATLPAIFRGIALAIAEEAGEQIDRVIYDQNRLFRLPDTRHTSGLYKVELTPEEFRTSDTDQVRFLARNPRWLKAQPDNLEPTEPLSRLFARIAGSLSERRAASPLSASGQGVASDLAAALAPAYTDGQKHNLVLAFAGYAAKRHLPRETALGVVDLLLEAKDDRDNLETAVNDTYDRVREGVQVKGYRELQELLADESLAALRAALKDEPAPRAEGEAPTPARERTEDPRVTFDALLGEVLDEFARQKMEPIDATPTPWPAWNAVCRGEGGAHGIARGWHVVVGARSGNGKSLLGANLAAAAIEHGERVGVVSLEMSQIEMATRILSITAKEPVGEMEHGQYFRPETWRRASRKMAAIYERTGGLVLVNRRPMNRLSDVADAIRHLHEREGVRYFVVDYLQLAAIGGGGAAGLVDRITEVSFVVRGLAKDLHVTTVGMSQLNRETSKAPETPRKEGLYGGAPLENDAEQVLLLDHSRIEKDPDGIASYAVLDKNRHGPVVEIPTHLSIRTLRMEERLADVLPSKAVG
jgi:replicative DNA helicase